MSHEYKYKVLFSVVLDKFMSFLWSGTQQFGSGIMGRLKLGRLNIILISLFPGVVMFGGTEVLGYIPDVGIQESLREHGSSVVNKIRYVLIALAEFRGITCHPLVHLLLFSSQLYSTTCKKQLRLCVSMYLCSDASKFWHYMHTDLQLWVC